MLCPGYISAPFNEKDRFKLQALHSMTMVKVIARHIKLGYRLIEIERRGSGYIIDLLFEAILSARKRLVEVKSSNKMREVYKIQAALYAQKIAADEVAVSNREIDEVLTSEFVQEIQRRAELTHRFLTNDPVRAAATFTPHLDICYTCANPSCPFLPRPSQSAASS